MPITQWIETHRRSIFRALLTTIIYALLIWLIWRIFPESFFVDWVNGLRPAALELLHARTPYSAPGIYNPPWAFLPLIPLALLPAKAGAILLIFATFFGYIYIARRLGASLWMTIAILLLPQVALKAMTNPNIDVIAAFGFILPPQIGLFFLAIKPQIGIAVALFWLVESYRRAGLKEVIRVFLPVTLALVASFLLFGPYFLRARDLIGNPNVWWDYELWPYSIPIGLALLAAAIRKRVQDYSITASPFLSPYAASYTWPLALFGLFRFPLEFYTAYAGFWVITLYDLFIR